MKKKKYNLFDFEFKNIDKITPDDLSFMISNTIPTSPVEILHFELLLFELMAFCEVNEFYEYCQVIFEEIDKRNYEY